MSSGPLVAISGIVGLCAGSFATVLVARVPAGLSIATPRSACASCGRALRFRDLVPVLSWLALRARCGQCGSPVSRTYPAVEIGTALAWMAVALRLGATWELLPWLYLATIGVALAVIDVRHLRLPNALTVGSYPIAAILWLPALLLPRPDPARALTMLAAGAAVAGVLALLAWLRPGGMGWGDVKLAGLLGAYLGSIGWPAVLVGVLIASVSATVVALAMATVRRRGLRQPVPFGPFLLLGTFAVLMGADGIWDAYLDALGRFAS